MKVNLPSFDIVNTLTMIFQDIQSNGVHQQANFVNGWICPIYKKKDCVEISNYWPIMLLNTDEVAAEEGVQTEKIAL